MSEVIKDSAIKLFGQTICVPPAAAADASLSQHSHRHSSLQSSTSQDSKDSSTSEYESSNNNPSEEKSASSSISSDKSSSDGGGPQKKIIPCPRCSSMDTKFCYFNNYNVNQPRHFCKKCQRYWTCGGSMRNVAVGSGRRKTKSSSSYHGIMVSDADAFVFSPHGFYPAAFYCNAPSVLGKHSRENLDGVLVPKTLRIHDPSEAAKSSIWTTLGIKGERRPAGDERAVLLRANPAAFSRSLNFHETA